MLHCCEAAKIQVNLQNPTKFTETHKVLQNLPEILSNTCQFFTGNNYQWVHFSVLFRALHWIKLISIH